MCWQNVLSTMYFVDEVSLDSNWWSNNMVTVLFGRYPSFDDWIDRFLVECFALYCRNLFEIWNEWGNEYQNDECTRECCRIDWDLVDRTECRKRITYTIWKWSLTWLNSFCWIDKGIQVERMRISSELFTIDRVIFDRLIAIV